MTSKVKVLFTASVTRGGKWQGQIQDMRGGRWTTASLKHKSIMGLWENSPQRGPGVETLAGISGVKN